MFDTRVIPIGAAGTGARAWVLQGGWQIAGIKIDNKSGSWIALPDGAFCPPYTIGWGHSFQPTLASIDVLFSTGPASQISTRQGDDPVVTIYSNPVGESPGIPSGQGTAFVEQFTPNSTTFDNRSVNLAGDGATLVPVVANRRYRLIAYSIAYDSGPQNQRDVSGFAFRISSTDFATIVLEGHVGPRPENYGTGIQTPSIDFPVGQGIVVSWDPDWADVRDVSTMLVWQLI